MSRTWNLWLSTGVKDSRERHDTSIYIVATDEEIKTKLLEKLKTVIRRRKGHKHIHAILFPHSPRSGENFTRAEDIIRVKDRYSNRRLVRIVNPSVALVQGYGPQALEGLGR